MINIDRLYEILNDTRLRRTEHSVLNQWMKAKGEIDFVRQVQKVGTVCPRIEVKFLPLTIDEWEEQRRCKPEPVSISIHQKGEVQLAGNAEYKVLQAFWYISDKIAKGGATLLLPNLSKSRDSSNASNTGRGSKRKLEVNVDEIKSTDLTSMNTGCYSTGQCRSGGQGTSVYFAQADSKGEEKVYRTFCRTGDACNYCQASTNRTGNNILGNTERFCSQE